MIEFRKEHPVKLILNPKKVNKHTEYKQELKADFRNRCGYCNDSDYWTGGWRFYQIDHFVPQKHLNLISKTEYSNLVYSCFFCNNSKRAKWPSENEKITIKNNEGFVNPRNEDYVKHLKRDINGNIIPNSEIGAYMVRAMKLNLKRHGIFWRSERVEELLNEIEKLFNEKVDFIPKELHVKITKLLFNSREMIRGN